MNVQSNNGNSNAKVPQAPQQNVTNQANKDAKELRDKLNTSDVLSKITTRQEAKEPKEVFATILDGFGEIDFYSLNGLTKRDRLKEYHYTFAINQTIKDALSDNGWRIGKFDESTYLFNGCYWVKVETEMFRRFLIECSIRSKLDRAKAVCHRFTGVLYNDFLNNAGIKKPLRSRDCVLINLLNGTVEITPNGATLRDFRSGDFLLYQLEFEYEPKAEAPLFNKYLNDVLPKDSQRLVAEFIGYGFIPNTVQKLEKMLLAYGTGANGKSVLIDIVSGVLGRDNLSSFALSDLCDTNSYYRYEIGNKILNIGSELSPPTKSQLGEWKKLVSGEVIEANRKYKNPVSLDDYARFWFNCNELPREVEHTEGFFRRFLIIPFTKTITAEQRITNLSQKILESESAGVFNWVLDGLNRLLQNGRFSDSESANNALEQFKRESNPVALYLEQEADGDGFRPPVEGEPHGFLAISYLYERYEKFCDSDGYKVLGKKRFVERMEGLGFEKMKHNTHKKWGFKVYGV